MLFHRMTLRSLAIYKCHALQSVPTLILLILTWKSQHRSSWSPLHSAFQASSLLITSFHAYALGWARYKITGLQEVFIFAMYMHMATLSDNVLSPKHYYHYHNYNYCVYLYVCMTTLALVSQYLSTLEPVLFASPTHYRQPQASPNTNTVIWWSSLSSKANWLQSIVASIIMTIKLHAGRGRKYEHGGIVEEAVLKQQHYHKETRKAAW